MEISIQERNWKPISIQGRKTKHVLFLAFNLWILFLASLFNTASAHAATGGTTLIIPIKLQQVEGWCWSAAIEAVLGYYQAQGSSQCQIVSYATGRSCCQSPVPDQCRVGGYMWLPDSANPKDMPTILANWNRDVIYHSRYLYMEEIKKELDNGRPFIFNWYWNSYKYGHALVGYGWSPSIYADNPYLQYYDPDTNYPLEETALLKWVQGSSQSEHFWDATLKMNPAPILATGSATNIFESSAILNGKITPNDSNVKVFFEYWPSTSNVSTSTGEITVTGTDTVPLSVYLTGLEPDTSYYYRLKANGTKLTYSGNKLSFNTSRITKQTLNIAISGSGKGYVTTSTGWNGTSGSILVSSGTQVTLSSTQYPGSIFVGWSGACTGKGVCVVTMDTEKTVTANFMTDINPILNLLLED